MKNIELDVEKRAKEILKECEEFGIPKKPFQVLSIVHVYLNE